MTNIAQSPRWGLPYLEVAQAQKEFTHNEALVRVDALVHPAVVGMGVNDPPAAPTPGDCWIVGASPTGAWTGRADHLACWTSGGWRFVAPRLGMAAVRLDQHARCMFTPAGWISADPVALPTGGTTVDSEARAAIAALLATLAEQGLVRGAV